MTTTTTAKGPASPDPATDSTLEEKTLLAERIQRGLEDQLLPELARLAAAGLTGGALRTRLHDEALRHCNPPERVFSASERIALAERSVDSILGWGPFEKPWRDDSVEEILVNGLHGTFVDRSGRLERIDLPLQDDASLRRLVARLCARSGLLLDEQAAQVNATLPDGSRMHAVLGPFAAGGDMISLRRATARQVGIAELMQQGTASREMLEFLSACVKARLNLVIAGPAGSGKTALLGALARQVPAEERVAAVEQSPELRLPNVRTLSFVAAPAAGRPPVEVRKLLRGALAMRPDRLVLGECCGNETGEFLDALAAGREGALTTIEAPTVRDALARLETLALRSNPGTPPAMVRRQIVMNVQIVVLMSRLRRGVPRVAAISEVAGMEGDALASHDLFHLLPSRPGQVGQFESCGNTPNCLDRLQAAGNSLSPAFFQRRGLGTAGEHAMSRVRE